MNTVSVNRSLFCAVCVSAGIFSIAHVQAKVQTGTTTNVQKTWPPAGCTSNCNEWVPVKSSDFSSHHNVLIRNEDGSLTPMDQPYFRSTQIAPGTWQVLSDGDYSYLIAGEKEALVIDSTYGAGNIRTYEQSLTSKPIHAVANTHYHFDHTANNAYFDRAYMNAYTKARATIPYKSFSGILFPRNYPITVIDEGYTFHLGGRDLEVFNVPNHAMGDIAFLDRKQRILFAGDLFSQSSMPINAASNVERFAGILRKLAAHRNEFDRVAGGYKIEDAAIVDHCLANAEYILAGHEGVTVGTQQGNPPPASGSATGSIVKNQVAPVGTTVYTRHMPHTGDGGAELTLTTAKAVGFSGNACGNLLR